MGGMDEVKARVRAAVTRAGEGAAVRAGMVKGERIVAALAAGRADWLAEVGIADGPDGLARARATVGQMWALAAAAVKAEDAA